MRSRSWGTTPLALKKSIHTGESTRTNHRSSIISEVRRSAAGRGFGARDGAFQREYAAPSGFLHQLAKPELHSLGLCLRATGAPRFGEQLVVDNQRRSHAYRY